MADYVLSRQAEDDLLNIYEMTEIKFGQYQADAYHSGLERSFSLLADFPRTGTCVDQLAEKFRRFRFQSHYIFYTEDKFGVLIRALVHVKMNLHPNLSE